MASLTYPMYFEFIPRRQHNGRVRVPEKENDYLNR